MAAAAATSPGAAHSSTLAISVDRPVATIGESVTIHVQGSATDRFRRHVRVFRYLRAMSCPPAPLLEPYSVIDTRVPELGSFSYELAFTHDQPTVVTFCAYTPQVGGHIVAGAAVTFILPPPSVNAIAPLEGRTGSLLRTTVTGYGRDLMHVFVHVRQSAAPCGATLDAERALPGTAQIARLVLRAHGPFSVPVEFPPYRAGLHRICAYLVNVTEGQNPAGDVARVESTAHVTDGLPPRVAATPSFATAGRASRLRFTLDDDTGPTGATVTVRSGARLLATLRVPARSTPVARTATWRPPARLQGTLRFCVAARDAAGHARTACSTVLVRRYWPCGEPTPTRRAGRCDTPATVPRGADAGGFLACGDGLTARWATCATARRVVARLRARAPLAGWTCSAAWRQCVAPLPRDAYVLWR